MDRLHTLSTNTACAAAALFGAGLAVGWMIWAERSKGDDDKVTIDRPVKRASPDPAPTDRDVRDEAAQFRIGQQVELRGTGRRWEGARFAATVVDISPSRGIKVQVGPPSLYHCFH